MKRKLSLMLNRPNTSPDLKKLRMNHLLIVRGGRFVGLDYVCFCIHDAAFNRPRVRLDQVLHHPRRILLPFETGKTWVNVDNVKSSHCNRL